ncbi:helix-turn-helix domain-containing protein [Lacticaseibacillus sharpeae]|uniref:HTH cro/C1-type domain-containing protein n=1 Tax=Lacticaseibacillus sharpeae JCM 1186 = DSM 20505 TaxID=1291052 RepID=A0A0R1ZKB5_9LACO|nr:helix-turn-helix transcriptional regulator [Lacticaseibacillus sharpeae]KRM55406.1 hypothetical protein FC18_GL001301 [Lacticaseibacillus sharpeae JCM 1186 = DSM 20505]
MAYEIGPVLRNLREAQDITQAKLYQGLLSPRQVIRLEQGASDIKAGILLTVLQRLHITMNDLQALLPPLAAENRQDTPPSVLNRALAKVTQWADWPLTDAEERAIDHFILTGSTMTLSQINTLLPLMPVGRHEHLWQKMQQFTRDPDYLKVAFAWCHISIHDYLFKGDIASAKTVMRRWNALPLTARNEVWTRTYFKQLVAALPDQETVYAATDQMLSGWRLLDGAYADALVDNRRHALTGCHAHKYWTEAELGATARLLTHLPQTALQEMNISAYLQRMPGLTAELQRRGMEIMAFKDYY